MKTLLFALALVLNAKGALIVLNWSPVDGATNYEATLLTNSVPVIRVTNQVAQLTFVPDFKTVYELRTKAVLTNEVRVLPSMFYELKMEYPDCVVDHYAWTTNVLGEPLWSFAHIPFRKYRMGGTNTVSPPQGVQMHIVP